MSRTAVLLLLVACGTADSKPPPVSAGLEAWLETWDEARRCLVADGHDLETGVAISILTGRDCTKPLHQLQIQGRVVDEVDGWWRAAVDRIRKVGNLVLPSRRAALIAEIDERVRLLSLVSRHVSPVPAPAATLKTLQVQATPDGVAPESDLAWLEEAMEKSRDRFVVIAGAADGSNGVVVRRPAWRSAEHAYELWISANRGASWQTQMGPARSHIVDRWQDLATGTVELLIKDHLGLSFVHRITPGAARVIVPGHDTSRDLGSTGGVIRCDQGGVMWEVEGDRAARFGGKALQLDGSARDGQVACRGDVAVVLRRDPDQIERCERHCRSEWFAAPELRGSIAMLKDRRWVYAANLEQVVAVWVEDQRSPRFFRLPVDGDIVGLAMKGGRLVLTVTDGSSSVAVLLP